MSTRLALGFLLLVTACTGASPDDAPPVPPTSVRLESPQAPAAVRGTAPPAAAVRASPPRRLSGQRTAAEVLDSDDLAAFDAMATTVAAQKQALGAKKMECIGKGLALDSSMSGHVELDVRLNADGTVKDTEVVSNRGLPPAVVACVRRAVKETRFLAPATPRELTRTESAGIP